MMEEAESEAHLAALIRSALWPALVVAARMHAHTYRSPHALAAAAAALSTASAVLPEVQSEALQLAERVQLLEPTDARAIVLTSCLLRLGRFSDALHVWRDKSAPVAARERARVLSDWGTYLKAAHAHPPSPACLLSLTHPSFASSTSSISLLALSPSSSSASSSAGSSSSSLSPFPSFSTPSSISMSTIASSSSPPSFAFASSIAISPSALASRASSLPLSVMSPSSPSSALSVPTLLPCALAEAAVKYRASIAACESYAPAHFNLGVVLAEVHNYAEARTAYETALLHEPTLVDAHINLGALARLTSQLAEAAEHYSRALAISPGLPLGIASLAITLTDLGTAHKSAGRMRDALQCYQRALRLRGDYAPAWYNLGVAYAEKGRIDKAVAAYHACLLLHPGCYEAHNNLGVLYKDSLEDAPRALAHYQAALALQPYYPQTLNNVGVLYTLLGRIDEARAALDAAQQVSGGRYAEAWNNLGVLARDEGDMEQAIVAYERALEAEAKHANAAQNRLLALNYVPLPHMQVYDAHRAWGRALEESVAPLPAIARPSLSSSPSDASSVSAHTTIRLGLLSPDFCLHSVSYFVEALLRHCPRPALHITCFAASNRADLRTAQLRSLADAWVSIAGLSAERAALVIRENRIDVLLELAGHTAGNRLDVCALRPAPVQGAYIGYPNTTGLASLSFRLTDAIADPPSSEQRYSEKLVRMDGCFLCYTPFPLPCPVSVSPLPALTAGFITFGCFNTLAKLSNQVLATWAALLRAVPNSRLLLKSKALTSPRVVERYRSALQVPSHRFVCLPLAAQPSEHLATYGAVDLALDTFPYAGTTTTCEAFLMGVPIVTLIGPVHAHNVSASLIHALGLAPERFIAHTSADYVRLAVALVSDLPQLAALRSRLRPQMMASLLCDGSAFAAKFERAVRKQYTDWLSGQ